MFCRGRTRGPVAPVRPSRPCPGPSPCLRPHTLPRRTNRAGPEGERGGCADDSRSYAATRGGHGDPGPRWSHFPLNPPTCYLRRRAPAAQFDPHKTPCLPRTHTHTPSPPGLGLSARRWDSLLATFLCHLFELGNVEVNRSLAWFSANLST